MKTSKKWVVFNKCRTKNFTVCWLRTCTNWYWSKVEASKSLFVLPHKMDQLIWLYDYSFKRGYIDITFEDFKLIVREKYDPEILLFSKKKKYHSRYKQKCRNHNFGWGKQHVVSNRYRKKLGHGISDREKNEAKLIWREISGKQKEVRKGTRHKRWKRHYKRQTSSGHRAWVKQNLWNENYDAFHPKERVGFENIWDYL